jgi:succinoglycan biosynthesis protein ExoM
MFCEQLAFTSFISREMSAIKYSSVLSRGDAMDVGGQTLSADSLANGRPDASAAGRPNLKVVVALCTSQRPKMLQTCLDSLVHQTVPPGVSLTIAVVENHSTDSCRGMVDRYFEELGTPRIVYAHEPRLGIPIARNRSMDLALAEGADWIAFIDDDEVAETGWIAALVGASRALPSADAWEGVVERVCVGPNKPCWLNRRRDRWPEGTRLDVAATNNSMIRASLVRAGLRFDERMRFTGGSDREFFLRARAEGATIHHVGEAVVLETWPAERCTLAWRLRTDYRNGAVRMCIDLTRSWRDVARHLARSLGEATLACAACLVAVPLYLLSRDHGRRQFIRALRRFSRCGGSLGVLLRLATVPHRTIEGF